MSIKEISEAMCLTCDQCGVIIDDPDKWSIYDSGDFTFCSEHCAQQFCSDGEALEEGEDEDYDAN